MIYDGLMRITIYIQAFTKGLFQVLLPTLNQDWGNFHEYLIQHHLKSGGTKDHFRRVKVPGTAGIHTYMYI
jgi:hypothetical protein